MGEGGFTIMATANNAFAAYQGTRIKTASPEELTLMLYDGAIKFCNIAKVALAEEDIEKASKFIIKANKIVVEFRCTLDLDYEVSKDFDRVYEYIYYALVDANIKKDPELVEEALYHLRIMRDTWKEVIETVKGRKTS